MCCENENIDTCGVNSLQIDFGVNGNAMEVSSLIEKLTPILCQL